MSAPKKDDKAAKPAGDGADDGAKKKKKMLMFIGLAVLLVLISVGATFFVVKKMMAKPPEAAAGEQADESAPEEDTAAVEAAAVYFPLKPNFTVNFDVNGRQRFLQADITLLYRDPAVLPLLELHMPAIRNSLVMLLSSQNFDDLQTIEGKEHLKEEALSAVREIIEKETVAAAKKEKEKSKDKKVKRSDANVEKVLFTQFVMQ